MPSHRRSAFPSISQELSRNANRKSGTPVTVIFTVKCPMVRPQRHTLQVELQQNTGILYQERYMRSNAKNSRACHGPTLVGRPGPPIFDMMGHGPARPIQFNLVGRGPAWPVKFSEDGQRPGPAHQIFRGWATARPSPSRFQKFPVQPGPSFFQKSRPGLARPGPSYGSEAHETQALYGPARQLRGPAHALSRTKRCMCIR